MNRPLQIGLLLFPDVTQLDLTGPWEVFARTPGVECHLIWKDLQPVRSDRGLSILPTTTFADCPPLDVICVPGGPGQIALMSDDITLNFLRQQADQAKWVTSVCTGSLVLGAAGLLKGYRATSHWSSIDQLALLGAEPVSQRVVRDRNRISGAGVTSGIDFALDAGGRNCG
ncbi:transcriptional activator FtrA [Pantoea agglomerans]|uniref:Transcriptional activator FtrA n=1 Tax=Enterobacter agglomerans TaxID=549 RepID=A0A379LRV2_ENTAG|nr:transcriptional activator FtrA [Pantoea agglomerans]